MNSPKNSPEAASPASAPADPPPRAAGPPAGEGGERVRSYYTDYVVDEHGKWSYVERLIEEEFAPPPQGWLGRLRRPLAAVLVLGAAVGLWIWRGEPPAGAPIHEEGGRQLEEQLDVFLQPGQLGEEPGQRQLSAELADKAKFLLEQGDEEQNVLAKIVLKNDEGANLLIGTLKREPLMKLFRLLTLEGHNAYNTGEFDRAVKSYEQALVLRPEDPGALRNAAIAHSQARQGDGAAHWRRAIELLEQAAGLVPDSSAQWCELQNNLGLAWSQAREGDRGENLARAIAVFRSAQSRYVCDGNKVLWAKLQYNMGAVWLNMGGGDQAGSLNNAVAAFQQALQVYTPKDHPFEWAIAQNRLGDAWMGLAEQAGGNPRDALEQALKAFRSAAQLFNRDDYPLEWARLQDSIGAALDRLPDGDRAENRRQAIEAFQKAEKVYSRLLHPSDWAANRLHQAATLKHMADAEAKGCGSLWQAQAYLKAAAELWTPEAFPDPSRSKIAPLAQALREAWRAKGCGAERMLEDIPAAK